MTGRTHAIIGANSIWLAKLFGLPFDPLLIIIGAGAALLPDLDASESMIKNLTVGVGSGRSRINIKPFAPVALIFSLLFKHRGWLHSAAAVVIVAAVSWLLCAKYGFVYPLVITTGYASHLCADAFTKSGIQFILPIHRSIHLLPAPLRITTGDIFDHGLFIIGALTLVLALIT